MLFSCGHILKYYLCRTIKTNVVPLSVGMFIQEATIAGYPIHVHSTKNSLTLQCNMGNQ